MKKPLEELLPPAQRDQIRAAAMAEAPAWYNPWVHLAVPSAFAIAVIIAALTQLETVLWWELAVVPVIYVYLNVQEWYIHKYLLHHRSPLAPVLYDRHTPQHHMIYVTDDMAVRSWREFHLVLIPAYGLFLISLGLVPVTALLAWATTWNIAMLYAATGMFYAASYEWLHLSYHLPADSRIGQLRLIRWLRNHHAVHHDPRLMQRWNFNVTIPLGDWLKGTIVQDEASPAREGLAGA